MQKSKVKSNGMIDSVYKIQVSEALFSQIKALINNLLDHYKKSDIPSEESTLCHDKVLSEMLIKIIRDLEFFTSGIFDPNDLNNLSFNNRLNANSPLPAELRQHFNQENLDNFSGRVDEIVDHFYLGLYSKDGNLSDSNIKVSEYQYQFLNSILEILNDKENKKAFHEIYNYLLDENLKWASGLVKSVLSLAGKDFDAYYGKIVNTIKLIQMPLKAYMDYNKLPSKDLEHIDKKTIENAIKNIKHDLSKCLNNKMNPKSITAVETLCGFLTIQQNSLEEGAKVSDVFKNILFAMIETQANLCHTSYDNAKAFNDLILTLTGKINHLDDLMLKNQSDQKKETTQSTSLTTSLSTFFSNMTSNKQPNPSPK